jgi:outer membrane immunogenic protein
MKKVLFAIAALSGLATAGSASAADLPLKAPMAPVAPLFSWTGCYVGANGGGTSNDTNFTTSMDPGTHLGNPANLAAVGAAGTGSALDGGALIGGQAGCNWQTGQFVIGLEGDFDYEVLQPTPVLNGTGVLTTGDTFATTDTLKTKWLATVRPRAGFALDRNLFYVTGGVAFRSVTLTQTYNDTLFNAVGGSSASASQTGWTVGGGWEYAFERNVSFKIEYLYAKFPTINALGTIVSATGASNVLHGSADLASHIGRVGLNYRF